MEKRLSVQQLAVGFKKRKKVSDIIKGISFEIGEGEIVGIVGESGSGKSVTALSIMGLLPENARITNGSISLDGRILTDLNEKELSHIQGKDISMVFQEPMTSLNPVLKIGRQVGEVLKRHRNMGKDRIKAAVLDALAKVGLNDAEKIYGLYPYELSGGMRQRVMIAMAMICEPKLLIADEPTTALDVTVQAQILQLLRKIHEKTHTSVLFISHDLNVVKEICHRVLVMYQGQIVEQGPVSQVFYHPRHEYTKQLIASVPNRAEGLPEPEKILEIKDLNVFYEERSLPFSQKKKQHVLKNISLDIYRGEIFGLVGESGSGKSTLAKTVVGLNPFYTGEIIGRERHPQMIFQDPYSSLNPSRKIGWILEEPLKIHGVKGRKNRRRRVEEMLGQIGLEPSCAQRYAGELSGGQRQRVSIGTALMLNPELVAADEAVSALDVTVQSQILNLLLELHETKALTYLFISHDLNIVRHMCHRVAVMYLGEIVEIGEAEEIYKFPGHPYTKLLFDSVLAGGSQLLDVEVMENTENTVMDGGCPFWRRCRFRMDQCSKEIPDMVNVGSGEHPHQIKCFQYNKQ